MLPFIFGYRVDAHPGEQRKASLIEEIMFEERIKLNVAKEGLKKLPGTIEKKNALIEELKEFAWHKDTPDHERRRVEYVLLNKHDKELRTMTDRLEKMPLERDTHTTNLNKLTKELEEARMREAVKAAKLAAKEATTSTKASSTSAVRTLPKVSQSASSRVRMGSTQQGNRTEKRNPAARPPPSHERFNLEHARPGYQNKRKAGDEAEEQEEELAASRLRKAPKLRNRRVVEDDDEEASFETPSAGTATVTGSITSLSGSSNEKSSASSSSPPNSSSGLSDGKKRKATEEVPSQSEAPARKVAKKAQTPSGPTCDPKTSSKPETTGQPASAAQTPVPKIPMKTGKKLEPRAMSSSSLPPGKRRSHNKVTKKPIKGVQNIRKGGLNGLINHNQSCFSSVVIQMLDAALKDDAVDELLGVFDDDDSESFGLSDQDCREFDAISHGGDVDKKMKKVQKELRVAIREAAQAGETDKVSAAKHLRTVIHNLRQEYHGAADKNVSPYMFQMVMAFGAAENADHKPRDLSVREMMSGDTQQDCFEYYQTVLNTLISDPHVGDSNKLQKLFQVDTQTQDVCRHQDCEYKSGLRTASSNYYDVNVPKTEGSVGVTFGKLFSASLSSKREGACPKCSNNTLVSKTSFTKAPENLVVKMSRIAYDDLFGETTKVETFVDLNIDGGLIIKGVELEITAVIRHEGPSTDSGHYNIFRKSAGDWFLLNDKDCTKKTATDVKDHARDGKCAMLLLSRVEADE